jgi:hypothetical protein
MYPAIVIMVTIPEYIRLTPSPAVWCKRRWLPLLRGRYNQTGITGSDEGNDDDRIDRWNYVMHCIVVTTSLGGPAESILD